MNDSIGNLTVYFEEPFWVGVFERIAEERLSACKVIFGAEPKDYTVWEFILRHYGELEFGPAIKAQGKPFAAGNPKRRQRRAKKQLQSTGVGTKSQQALAARQEELKIERKKARRERQAAEQQRQFDLRRQKRKEKHRGHH